MKQKINLKRMLNWLSKYDDNSDPGGHGSISFYSDGSGTVENGKGITVFSWNDPQEYEMRLNNDPNYIEHNETRVTPTLKELLRNLEAYDFHDDGDEFANVILYSDGSGQVEKANGEELFEFETIGQLKTGLANLAKKEPAPAATPVICIDCGQPIIKSQAHITDSNRHQTWSLCEQALLDRLKEVRKIRNG